MIDVVDLPDVERRPLLERIAFHGLVFGMSWEDPEVDRIALDVRPEDTVLTITTAGCNALNLLCLGPRALICVDANPVQTALLELKLAGIASLDHETFFDIFAARDPTRITAVYRTRMRSHLSRRARAFWDDNLALVRGNIYRAGHMGLFFRAVRAYLRSVRLDPRHVDEFFELSSLAEQRDWYARRIAAKLWGRRFAALARSRPLLYLAGMHPRQVDLLGREGDVFHVARTRVEHALRELPITDNYFWSMLVTGRFRGANVPPYLRRENFERLAQGIDRVRLVNGWLDPLLNTHDAQSIDKFNLLDTFDWMPAARAAETMARVRRVARRGARVLSRSAATIVDVDAARENGFAVHTALARDLVARDRSATHGSVTVLSLD